MFKNRKTYEKKQEVSAMTSDDFMIDFLDSPLATLLATKTERSFNCPGNCQK